MIIHPGFIKTGTTSLQDFLFFEHPGIHAFGHPHRSAVDVRVSQALRRIEGFDDDPAGLRSALDAALDAGPDDRVPVLSDETLTADPKLTATVARRLHRHFPQARILFTLRRQEDMIRSFYGRHGRVLFDAPAPYRDRHVRFADWLEHACRIRPAGVLGVADYQRTIEIYRGLFGQERIAIVLLEEWAADPQAFADRLAAILGVEAATTRQLLGSRRTHAQETARYVLYDRLSKRFPAAGRLATRLPAGVRTLGGGFLRRGDAQRAEFPPGWPERLADLYREGNRKLAQRYGLPLREHGYAV
jgi:catechol 2,3-dioxygenase-like lactoylglutathione lyase family enzyme